jgi:putative ABC transport system permease protein
MEQVLRDFRFAARSLVRRPMVFAAATISLALGIAANTTIFATIDGFMLRPLPYPDANRIVGVWTTNPSRGWTRASTSMPDYLDWRRDARTMDLAAFASTSYNLADADRAERAVGSLVTASMFTVLGGRPTLGRTFSADAEQPGAPKVAVVSDAFWKRHFAGDSAAIGRSVKLDGEPYTVIGVMPSWFRFPELGTDVWTPMTHDGREKRADRNITVVGRLRSGNDARAADQELAAITSRLATQFDDDRGVGAVTENLQRAMLGPEFAQGASISTVAVVFVLLIACANVANLLLALGAARARELALRTAVGASRGRLVRQLLTESVVLGLAGGALGAMLSVWGVRAIIGIFPPQIPGGENVALNGRALAYTLGLSLVAAVVFGVAPAFSATKSAIGDVLREGGRGSTMSFRRHRLGASLVASEIALALVLLISAGLLLKGAIRSQTIDRGFDPDHVLTMRLTLPANQYTDTTRLVAFQHAVLSRLRSLPDVEAAGATTLLPDEGSTITAYRIEGRSIPGQGKGPISQYRVITPGYVDAMHYRVVRGRDLSDYDRLGASGALLVNETFARQNWPNGDALGRRLVFESAAGPVSREIVGIVGDVREIGPASELRPVMYFSAWQRPPRSLAIALRSKGDPAAIASAARGELSRLDPTIPAYAVRTMRALIDHEEMASMIMPQLLAAFGAIALLLAIVGVYGVMSYSVNQRTQEVGIRIALGAEGGDIVRLVLRQGAIVAGCGMVVGLGLAALTTRALATFLFGVSAFDPTVFGGVAAALLGAALLAGYVPARRAARVDPLIALRHD